MGCSSSTQYDDDGSPRHIDAKTANESKAPVAPGVVCGYLKKEGAIFTTWKKRFFYLEAGKVSWYESETSDKVFLAFSFLSSNYAFTNLLIPL